MKQKTRTKPKRKKREPQTWRGYWTEVDIGERAPVVAFIPHEKTPELLRLVERELVEMTLMEAKRG